MFNTDLYIQTRLRALINNVFPSLDISIYFNEDANSFVVAIQDEKVYYSETFLSLVTDIKLNFLWKMNIQNYLFIFDKDAVYNVEQSISSTTVYNGKYLSWSVSTDNAVLTVKNIDDSIFCNEYMAA